MSRPIPGRFAKRTANGASESKKCPVVVARNHALASIRFLKAKHQAGRKIDIHITPRLLLRHILNEVGSRFKLRRAHRRENPFYGRDKLRLVVEYQRRGRSREPHRVLIAKDS